MQVRPSKLLILLVLVALAGAVFLLKRQAPEIDADSPLAMPANGEPDHRFHFLSAWQTAEIPRALRFDPPLGSNHGGLVYNAQKFWEMNDKRGGHHTGDDLNGIGGMNTDLGDPVFCTADGRPLHSMYAHLHRIDVAPGALVPRGGKVGAVGTANGYYPAHLHFEMRTSDGVDIGAGYAMFPLNRLDPAATISALRNAGAEELSPAPLVRMLAADGAR